MILGRAVLDYVWFLGDVHMTLLVDVSLSLSHMFPYFFFIEVLLWGGWDLGWEKRGKGKYSPSCTHSIFFLFFSLCISWLGWDEIGWIGMIQKG